jgi:hypothetical protein
MTRPTWWSANSRIGRVDFHLAREHRTQPRVHRVPRRDFIGPLGEFARLRNDAELLLAREGFLAQLVPPWSNLPLYFAIQSFGTWCGACVAPGAK